MRGFSAMFCIESSLHVLLDLDKLFGIEAHCVLALDADAAPVA